MSNELVVLTDPKAIEEAKTIASSISVMESGAVMQYGVGPQTKISQFSDTVLAQVRNKDAGPVGEELVGLLSAIKSADVDGALGSSDGVLGKIFGFLSSVQKFIARYEKAGAQIDKIVSELQGGLNVLMRDIVTMDKMFQVNNEFRQELDKYIYAGKLKLEELRATKLPELRALAESTKDPLDAQRYNDFEQALTRFERRLYDLVLSRMIAIQTAPQIRLIQSNDQALVEKIQSSINITIPTWKNQVTIAVSLMRQKGWAEKQKAITDATNRMLEQNSAMLKQNTIAVAKENERGIVEIETLRKVNADLISTIEETIRIQEEGKAKRAQAEQDIAQMEAELKSKLTSLRQ